MTDFRPRLARDRDGIAIDAMAIGTTYAIWFGPDDQTHQIGPFTSNVVVRIATDIFTNTWIGTDAASLEAFVSHAAGQNGIYDNIFHVVAGSTERIHLPQGEALFMNQSNGMVSVTILK